MNIIISKCLVALFNFNIYIVDLPKCDRQARNIPKSRTRTSYDIVWFSPIRQFNHLTICTFNCLPWEAYQWDICRLRSKSLCPFHIYCFGSVIWAEFRADLAWYIFLAYKQLNLLDNVVACHGIKAPSFKRSFVQNSLLLGL